MTFSGTVNANDPNSFFAGGTPFSGTFKFSPSAATANQNPWLDTNGISADLSIGSLNLNSTGVPIIERVSDLSPSDEDYYYYTSGAISPVQIDGYTVESFEVVYQSYHIKRHSAQVS